MTTETEDKLDRARKQARAQLASVAEMVGRLDHARDCDGGEDCELTDRDIVIGTGYIYTEDQEVEDSERTDYHDADAALQVIEEDALSVEVRSEWHSPGAEDADDEYRILLCTGGPAVQIQGDIGAFGQPDSARLMCQDWFTPWTEVVLESDELETLLTYARCFYFGE